MEELGAFPLTAAMSSFCNGAATATETTTETAAGLRRATSLEAAAAPPKSVRCARAAPPFRHRPDASDKLILSIFKKKQHSSPASSNLHPNQLPGHAEILSRDIIVVEDNLAVHLSACWTEPMISKAKAILCSPRFGMAALIDAHSHNPKPAHHQPPSTITHPHPVSAARRPAAVSGCLAACLLGPPPFSNNIKPISMLFHRDQSHAQK